MPALARLAGPIGLALTLAGPAAAFDIEAMTEAERTAFRAEIRDYLLENPEVLMEAIGVLEQREQTAQAEADAALVAAVEPLLLDPETSWIGGNPDGDVTLVEFMDYRCGYCRQAFQEVEDLVSTDGDIRFVLKEFPILGEQSLLSSQFAIAVRQLHGDDLYKEVHDILMQLQGDATPETLRRLAEELALEPDPIFERMAAPEVAEVIEATHQLGAQLGINGTPTFILEDEMIRGYVPLDALMAFVEEKRVEG